MASLLVSDVSLAVSKPKTKIRSQPLVGAPFDLTIAKLPPNFAGNDFLALYRELAIPPKGEFETTEQYEARRQQIRPRPLAFRLPDVRPVYDADSGEFSVGIDTESFSRGWSSTNIDDSMLVIAESRTETGRYVGSNAFGVSRVVQKVTVRKW